MYINDLPLASKFQTTLFFTDNTYLCLEGKDLKILQIVVNAELQRVDNCFRRNKLLLNYNKTNFHLINKQLNICTKNLNAILPHVLAIQA